MCWANIGLFYLLYQFQFETVLIGVFRELTLIPSFLGGVIFPIILLIKLIRGKD